MMVVIVTGRGLKKNGGVGRGEDDGTKAIVFPNKLHRIIWPSPLGT